MFLFRQDVAQISIRPHKFKAVLDDVIEQMERYYQTTKIVVKVEVYRVFVLLGLLGVFILLVFLVLAYSFLI